LNLFQRSGRVPIPRTLLPGKSGIA